MVQQKYNVQSTALLGTARSRSCISFGLASAQRILHGTQDRFMTMSSLTDQTATYYAVQERCSMMRLRNCHCRPLVPRRHTTSTKEQLAPISTPAAAEKTRVISPEESMSLPVNPDATLFREKKLARHILHSTDEELV